MSDSESEVAVIYALVERFETQRLPRLLEIKERVDQGGVLSERDIQFMSEIAHDAQRGKRLVDRHPDWQRYCAEVIHLFEEVAEKALENEKNP